MEALVCIGHDRARTGTWSLARDGRPDRFSYTPRDRDRGMRPHSCPCERVCQNDGDSNVSL